MFVTEVPGSIAAAAGMVGVISGQLEGVNAAASEPVVGVMPPGGEEVSVLLAAAHNSQGASHIAMQGLGAAVLMSHIATLMASEGSYGMAEAANAITMI